MWNDLKTIGFRMLIFTWKLGLSPSRWRSILSLLIINNLTSVSNPLHCFAHNTTLHCVLSYSTTRQATVNMDQDRFVLGPSLVSDPRWISVWGSTYHICFNASEIFVLSIAPKCHRYSPQLNFDSTGSLLLLSESTNSSLLVFFNETPWCDEQARFHLFVVVPVYNIKYDLQWMRRRMIGCSSSGDNRERFDY